MTEAPTAAQNPVPKKVYKIVSGCQTGADRAGLEVGRRLEHLDTGGWCTKGNRTDEGPRPDLIDYYGLDEHSSSAYPPRTEKNVRDSNGTVLCGNMTSPGCSLTIALCKAYKRPYICNPTADELRAWLVEHAIEILNVAGNRERTNPGIYQSTLETLLEALQP